MVGRVSVVQIHREFDINVLFSTLFVTLAIRIYLSFEYPDSVRWQHFLAPHTRLVSEYFANITTRTALPQTRVETLIGSQVTCEIKTK